MIRIRKNPFTNIFLNYVSSSDNFLNDATVVSMKFYPTIGILPLDVLIQSKPQCSDIIGHLWMKFPVNCTASFVHAIFYLLVCSDFFLFLVWYDICYCVWSAVAISLRSRCDGVVSMCKVFTFLTVSLAELWVKLWCYEIYCIPVSFCCFKVMRSMFRYLTPKKTSGFGVTLLPCIKWIWFQVSFWGAPSMPRINHKIILPKYYVSSIC